MAKIDPTVTLTNHTHAATDIVSGLIAPSRMGSGTPNNTKFLRGDGVWAVPAGGGGGGATDHSELTGIGTNTHAQIDTFISTIAETVRDTMGAALVAGANVTITPNDAGDTITIAATGSGGVTDHTALTNIGTNTHAQIDTFISNIAETVRDTMGTALVAGTNVTITPNDAGDTITIAATGGGGGGGVNIALKQDNDTVVDANVSTLDFDSSFVLTSSPAGEANVALAKTPAFFNALDYGVVGNGTTDDATALNNALTAAATAKAWLIIPPPATAYRINSTLNLQNNSRVLAYGAIFHCYITSLGDAGTMAPMLQSMDKSNISWYGGEFDGRQSSWAHTEWKPAINIEGSTNVTIRDVYCHDNKGDGISVSTMTPNKHNNDVRVYDSRFDANYRGGGFVGEGKSVYFGNCQFNFNTGTSPMFGIDVEPDGDQSICEDIEFNNCDFSNNGVIDVDGAGFYVTVRSPSASMTATGGTTTTVVRATGMTTNQYRNCILRWTSGNNNGLERYVVSNTATTFTIDEAVTATANGDTFILIPRQRDIRFVGCRSEDNGIHGAIFYHSRSVKVIDCAIRNNHSRALEIRGHSDDILVDGCTMTKNVSDVIYFGTSSVRTITNVRIVNNFLRGSRDGGDGIEFEATSTYDRILIEGNDIADVATAIKVNGTLLTNLKLGVNNMDVTSAAKTSGLNATNTIPNAVLSIPFGTGTAPIATGVAHDYQVPYDCVVLGWNVVGDVSGNIVVDVWKDTYANFPPTVADTIAGTEKPTLSSQSKNQDLTLTTWANAGRLNSGDFLRFNVDSSSTVGKATLLLSVARVG